MLLTPVNHVAIMKVIDCFEDLPYGLRSVLLCELSFLAYSIEQLAASSQLCDNVVFVLHKRSVRVSPHRDGASDLRLEPVMEADNMWVMHLL